MLVPADQVKPEEIATLSIEYRNGQPVVVVSGGRYVPSDLPVVNSSGTAYASRFAWSNGTAYLHAPDPVSAPIATPSGSTPTFGQYTFNRNDPVNFVDLNGN
ncbi:hypothetical protein [Streptomyces sp. NPDC057494]|uniref:hypothetical protein n=1 Tax=Streptomyces sp. NPDC057494 TaxID=3346148 RepID=UPI003691A6FC